MRARRRMVGGAVALAVSSTFLAALCWPGTAVAVPVADSATSAEPPAVSAAAPTVDAAPTPAPTRREAVDAAVAPAAVDPPDFAACIDELIELGTATARHAAAEEFAAARASDDTARERFDALLHWFADAGERALALATERVASDADAEHLATSLAVLALVFDTELQRRSDPAHRDALVAAALSVAAQDPRLADTFVPLLVDRPHVHLPHEPAVLELVALAGGGAFPRALATALLLTLWDNLHERGERSSAELANLALLALDDLDPSRRTAACRHLVADPRFRPLALAWLREHQDVTVAKEVARRAALELPPDEALATLRELAPLLPSQPAIYLMLGHRAPQTLGQAYEQLLADDLQPGIRRDLLAGIGMTSGETPVALLELALANDPARPVRLQAMLSLSASVPHTHGESACHRLLDDPAVANDPGSLGVVLLALQNLEVAGLTNAVDRVGRRLRATPLPAEARQQLEGLLRRALPSGATGPGNGPTGSGGGH